MPNFLCLDKDDKAVNYINMPDQVVRIIPYEGYFEPGAQFDGTVVVPTPDPEQDQQEG